MSSHFDPMFAADVAPPSALHRRLKGRIVDFIFMGAASYVAGAVLGTIGLPAGWGAALGASIAWLVQIALISTRGQSIGKILAGTVIVDRYFESVGFVRGVLLREWPIFWLQGYVVSVLMILNAAFAFRDDRRCLHDHFAGTRVIDIEDFEAL